MLSAKKVVLVKVDTSLSDSSRTECPVVVVATDKEAAAPRLLGANAKRGAEGEQRQEEAAEEGAGAGGGAGAAAAAGEQQKRSDCQWFKL